MLFRGCESLTIKNIIASFSLAPSQFYFALTSCEETSDENDTKDAHGEASRIEDGVDVGWSLVGAVVLREGPYAFSSTHVDLVVCVIEQGDKGCSSRQ